MMPITKCPECGSKYLIHNNKEVYCSDCGLVVEEYLIDHGPEWRAYDSEQASKRTRTGPGMTYRVHDKGLSTAAPKLHTKRLRWISMQSSEKTLAFALNEIDRMACALKLPNDIKEMTSVLYRKASKQNLIKGRSIEELVSAMLYIVCRQNGIPRTLKEISTVSRTSLKKIRKTYLHHLKRKMNIKLAPADPISYIPRFCSELGLNEAITQTAILILKQNEVAVSRMSSPVIIASAAIFRAAKGIKADDIAKVTEASKSSIEINAKKLI